MKRWSLISSIAAVAALSFALSTATAQDKPKDKPADKPAAKPADKPAAKPDDKKPAAGAEDKSHGGGGEADMMAMMMELGKPGDNHKLLASMEGDWTYVCKHMGTESTGSSKFETILGGRFVTSHHKGKMQMPGPDGKMMDFEFEGHGLSGYDNVQKKFTNIWVDNMGTMIVPAEGTYDAATKTITYTGEFEMMPGMKAKFKEVVKFTDKDHHSFEWWDSSGPNGEMVKQMEINYTRKK